MERHRHLNITYVAFKFVWMFLVHSRIFYSFGDAVDFKYLYISDDHLLFGQLNRYVF